MACNGDLWRFPVDTILRQRFIPHYWHKRIRNKGFCCNSEDKRFLIDVYRAPEDDFVRIPCGQCLECRLEYSRSWAVRCMLEASYYESNLFLTLTYDDDHLPYARTLDRYTGEVADIPILVKKDIQDFVKRLKSRLEYMSPGRGEAVRVYYCGEYGSQTARPHFHIILFNCDFEDKVLWKKKDGYSLYNSPLLSELWPQGYSVIGDVNFDSCAYVARYIMKKQRGFSAAEYDEAYRMLYNSDLEPELVYMPAEFVGMSRRPGIARRYYDEHKDEIYSSDKLVLPPDAKGKVRTVRPGRYFDSIYDLENPEEMAELKQLRKEMAEDSFQAVLKKTDLSEIEYKNLREQKLSRRVKKLVREI